MSLRLRLIGLVAIALIVSLLLGGAVAGLNASRSVGIEMRSALLVGHRVAANGASELGGSRDPLRTLENLVASFDGDRHLRVSLDGASGVIALPAIESSPFGQAPAWFVQLVGVPTEIDRVPVRLGSREIATIVLETDPRNETLDAWNDFNNTLIVLASFSSATILLIFMFIGRALRPLYLFSRALEQVGGGRYGIRLRDRLAPELMPLRNSFNRMAMQLAEADANNRSLNEQLVTLQEQERNDIARDLHDEVGPHLFAMNVDAAHVSRMLKEGRTEEAADRVQLIMVGVSNVQRELRGIVRRLQPAGLAEFGLRDAIDSMIGFWRQRHADVNFRLAVAEDCTGLGGLVDTTIYRIVQECLSNALRHGTPTAISVCIARAIRSSTGDEPVVVEISDNGTGITDRSGGGFGLRGMAERVKALGGEFTLQNGTGGGLIATAVLPHQTEHQHEWRQSSDLER